METTADDSASSSIQLGGTVFRPDVVEYVRSPDSPIKRTLTPLNFDPLASQLPSSGKLPLANTRINRCFAASIRCFGNASSC
jgi:hypothetical protein